LEAYVAEQEAAIGLKYKLRTAPKRTGYDRHKDPDWHDGRKVYGKKNRQCDIEARLAPVPIKVAMLAGKSECTGGCTCGHVPST
jgi:hypothetical protein